MGKVPTASGRKIPTRPEHPELANQEEMARPLFEAK